MTIAVTLDQTGIVDTEPASAASVTVPLTEAQTLFNNILNGAQSAEVLRFDEIVADPATPATGKWKLYCKAGGLYLIDDTGTVIGPFGAGGGGSTPGTCEGRLTLSSTLPVTTTDVTAATTLYFLPYKGEVVTLYNGATWDAYNIPAAGVSIAIPATTDTNYDVYLYSNGGTLTLDLTAWTNATTRATALAVQDGVYCKTGTLTRRYLGTIRTTGVSGQCEDSISKRFVWNYANRLQRKLKVTDPYDFWVESSSVDWLNWTGSGSVNAVYFVMGVAEQPVSLDFTSAVSSSSSAVTITISVGEDGALTPATDLLPSSRLTATNHLAVSYKKVPSIGYHYLNLLQRINNLAGGSFFGDNGGTGNTQSGAIGEIWG